MDRKQMVYHFICEDDYKPLKSKEMALLFGVPKKERKQFHDILDELVAEGKIILDQTGRYRLPEENVNTGVFMATSRGFGFVRVEGREGDVFIPEPYVSNAYDGDIVMVQIFREEGGNLRIAGDNLEKWYEAGDTEEELAPYRQAVDETKGQYLCYQGEPVQASYFRLSNGQTRNAEEVWHTDKCPYLTSTACEQDKASKDYSRDVTVSRVNFLYEIRSRIGEEYADQELWDGISFSYDSAGYVTDVSFIIEEKEVGKLDGETFRHLFSLPSASFEMEQGETKLIFHVTGAGHGFGMSQYGANSRALNGQTYDQILKDFFSGTELAKFE